MHEGHKEERIPGGEGNPTRGIIRLAIKVHRTLGPGLLEEVYEECLCLELERSGLAVARQVVLPLVYEGVQLRRAFRADLIVNEAVILEIKSIERSLSVYESQLLTYMRLSGCTIGLLMNFNHALLKEGLRRFVV